MKEIPLRDWGNLRRDGDYHLEEHCLSTPGNKIAVVFREESGAFPVAVRAIEKPRNLPTYHVYFDGMRYQGLDDGAFVTFRHIHAASGAVLTVGERYIPLDARPYEEALAEVEAEAVEEAKDVPLLDWGDLEPGFRYHLEVQMLPDPERFAVLFRKVKLGSVEGVRLVDRGTPGGARRVAFIQDPHRVTVDTRASESRVCLDFKDGSSRFPYRWLPAKAPSLEEARTAGATEKAKEATEPTKDPQPESAPTVRTGSGLLEWGDLDRAKSLDYYRVETAALPGRKVQLMFLTPDGEYVAGRVVEDYQRDMSSLVSSDIEIHLLGSGGGPRLCIEFCGEGGECIARRYVPIEVATEKAKEAPEPTKGPQPESATTSTQNHPVNVPLCDWGALNRGKAYDLERHDISERELAVVFRERGSGDVVAVRVVNPSPHDEYYTPVAPGDMVRFDPAALDVDFIRPGEGVTTYRSVSLDAPSLAELAQRNQLPDPKAAEEIRDQTLADLRCDGMREWVIQNHTAPFSISARPSLREEIRQRTGADFAPGSTLDAVTSVLERREASLRQELSELISRPAPEPTDLDAVKEIVEAVVHESTMDNNRSAANLQQHLNRIENTQATMESELLKISNDLASLLESSVGLAGAMQDMADGSTALCDTVGLRLTPIEATAGGVQSNQEALAKLSSDLHDFLGEVREQIVHLEAKVEDVQDAVWCRQADAWPDENTVAQFDPGVWRFSDSQGYRVESNGKPCGTRVINLKTGEEVKARSVTWSVDATGLPMAIIEVYDAALTANLPEEQVELIKLPLPGGYPAPEESKEETIPNAVQEPDAAVNKSRFFSMEWRSDSQAKASGRGAMWLMAALLFGALIGGMLMNMFPLWRSASSGLPSWSAPAPSPRPTPAPSVQAKASLPAKKEKSPSFLCR